MITKKISTLNYELRLLKTIRLRTNVFYISLLKLVLRNVKVDTKIKAEDFEEEFEVETILDSKVS